jgi:hypothetical protein
MKKINTAIFTTFLWTICVVSSYADSNTGIWTPDLKFRIENRSYTETLIFISGISYALSSTNAELKQLGKQNFYCLTSGSSVGSKLMIDFLNEKHAGSISSEQAIETIIHVLKTRYPCS